MTGGFGTLLIGILKQIAVNNMHTDMYMYTGELLATSSRDDLVMAVHQDEPMKDHERLQSE